MRYTGTTNKREMGGRYEQLSGSWLEKNGYEILEYNFRCRQGEIDIIAREDGYLVFVEVKFRSGREQGDPMEAVDYRKQKKISRVAGYYLISHGYSLETPCRFDVVSICDGQMKVVKNAFEYCV